MGERVSQEQAMLQRLSFAVGTLLIAGMQRVLTAEENAAGVVWMHEMLETETTARALAEIVEHRVALVITRDPGGGSFGGTRDPESGWTVEPYRSAREPGVPIAEVQH